ncbi:hypothetical protein [Brucella anthropi]|uniref:hypothetical protein n=1 Tax=Brucella anthropi TaxID=529 RepID=UPI00124F3B94|nr:hypothetical protein [Brucella anthropi]KAB2743486.1 hypothetical protein F9L05_23180 [Brucella anthropi]
MTAYETTWLPAEWQDEYIPETLRHPSDFIHKCDDGSFIIIPKTGKDDLTPEGSIEEKEHMLIKVSLGDIVRFQPTEQYGSFLLYVDGDQQFYVDRLFPEKANCFFLNATEAFGDSVRELVKRGGEDDSPLDIGEYDIKIYWWGDDIAFQFEIAPDGTPRFVEVGAIQ